ncbi:MAG: LacI family DNA-binding transcriptional regulator [Anaerolineae bacterium]
MNLEDIARKAGVSRSTVSRVINDAPNVSATTRDRVRQIIEAEKFHPNAAARALVTRRTDVIGVVIPSVENIFFTDNSYWPMLLAGLGQALRAEDYAMLLWMGEVTDNDERLMRKVSNHHMVDGLVFASLTGDHPMQSHLLEMRSPIVMIDKPYYNADCLSYVSIDNVRAGEMATEHLIKLGRKRIAHITGHLTITDGNDRLQGYKNALRNAGLPIDENLIYEGLFHRDAGYAGMKHLLQFKPDAVFAGGDTIAIGVLQAAHEAGVRIPDDVSVIGFDDIDVARTAIPQLTTIRQPVLRKGEVAARMVLDMVEGRTQGPQQVLLPTELVIRKSCGAG